MCHPGSLSDSRFADVVWQKRVDAVAATCAALLRLPDAHVQFTLLRCCLDACKVMDLLRACPYTAARSVCARFSRLLRDSLGTVVGTPLTDTQWAQATLPVRFGGLGILDPELVRLPARLAASVEFVSRGATLVRWPGRKGPLPGDWPVCLTAALLAVGSVQPLVAWRDDTSLLSAAEPMHRDQRWWSEHFYSAHRAALAASLTGPDAVRFASQQLPHAMAWAAVVPAAPLRTLLPTADFKCLLRFHLGAPLNLPGETTCPRCTASLDASGNHFVCCNKNGIVQRHGAVQDAVLRVAQAAGFVARKEQAAPDRTRPGDVFIARLDANGPAAVDITVRHTLAPSRPVRKPEDLPSWFQGQEREKTAKYQSQCRRLGWSMVPFVMDCFGGLGDEARSFLSTCLTLLLGKKELWARRSAEANVWQRISLALAREVARQLRLSRFVAASMEEEDWGEHVGSLGQGRPWTHSPYGPAQDRVPGRPVAAPP